MSILLWCSGQGAEDALAGSTLAEGYDEAIKISDATRGDTMAS